MTEETSPPTSDRESVPIAWSVVDPAGSDVAYRVRKSSLFTEESLTRYKDLREECASEVGSDGAPTAGVSGSRGN